MPATKAPQRRYIAWQVERLPYSVKAKSLIKKRKNGLENLSANQIRTYRKQLRKAIRFYVSRVQGQEKMLGTVTLTEQNHKLQKIATAARNLAKAIRNRKNHNKWLKKLHDRADSNDVDQNTQLVIISHLRKIGIPFYKDFLDQVWDRRLLHSHYLEGDHWVKMNIQSFYDYADGLLPLLEHMAALRNAPATKIPRWADPNLYFLIQQLAPLWVEATGRTWKHGHEIEKSHPYHFYDWLYDTLKLVGCTKGLSAEKVNGIAQRIKIKK